MIELLNWDSNFFGWKTGLLRTNNPESIEPELINAKSEGFRLVYVFGNREFYIHPTVTEKFDGKLVDRKIVYGMDISNPIINNLNETDEYLQDDIPDALLQLAFASGAYSRFKTDLHFKNNEFGRMYTNWISQSVKRLNADYVYITTDNDCITGMVTLKISDITAHIGLISTDKSYQGKGLGRRLIERCISTALQHNCHRLEVPTQLDNLQACKFYEAVGFKPVSVQNIYHFWL